jgi:hypothetical protein
VDAQHLEGSGTVATTLSGGSDLKIALSIPGTTASGIYRYTLKQTLNSKANEYGSYDATEYRVNLYVNKPTDGNAYVYMVQVYKQDTETGNWVKAEPKFANSITALEDLIIKNYVTNNVTPDKVGFEIALMVPVESDQETGVTLKENTDLGAYVLLSDGVTKIPCDGQEHDGRKYDKVVVSDTANKITLFSGESLIVPGVPVNMIYTTYNAEANKDGFVSTYDTRIGVDSEGNDLQEPVDRSNFASAVSGTNPLIVPNTVIKIGQNMIIYNNVNADISNTGVTMDTTPYVLMFVAAAGLAVLSLAKKKIVR